MNKIIYLFIFLIILFVPIFTQAQADKLEIVKANGTMIENASELLSFNFGSAGKNLLTDSLLVRNISNETLKIKVRKNEVSVVDGTFNTFKALSQSVPVSESITPNLWELGPNETLPIDAYFQGAYFLQNQFGTSTFLYSFLTLNEQEEVVDSVYITYHFLNNSVTPLDYNDEVFVNKEVLVTGDPSEEVLFPVKLFNHNSDSICMRVEKQILNLENGHDLYFSFGGVDYSNSDEISSEDGIYIHSMDTLTGEFGFVAKFMANGIDGNEELSKVNYRFFNKDEGLDQSDIVLVFNPSAVGFSELEEYDISSVFPNPAKDIFSIKYNLPLGVSSLLKVYNNIGLLVSVEQIDNQKMVSTFSISDWDSGIYYLSIEVDGKPIGTEKLIKE